MKHQINLYTGEHCTKGTIEGQLLLVGGKESKAACIIPLDNHMPNDPEWNTLLTFDGHHLTQGEYDGPLWVKDGTVKFSRTVEVDID